MTPERIRAALGRLAQAAGGTRLAQILDIDPANVSRRVSGEHGLRVSDVTLLVSVLCRDSNPSISSLARGLAEAVALECGAGRLHWEPDALDTDLREGTPLDHALALIGEGANLLQACRERGGALRVAELRAARSRLQQVIKLAQQIDSAWQGELETAESREIQRRRMK
jgi:hypothetical protein